MKIIIITQKIDKNDTVLGFFHTWLTELSTKFESVEVICLEKGKFDLPKNVTVYSLGKERGVSKISFVKNLYKYLFLIKKIFSKISLSQLMDKYHEIKMTMLRPQKKVQKFEILLS